MNKIRSGPERAADAVIVAFFLLYAAVVVVPFLNVIAESFSSEAAVISGIVTVYPIDFQTDTYRYVLSQPQFLRSFSVSVLSTVLGTLLSLCVTILGAYPLSKPRLRGRKGIMLLFIFAMMFNGGMVPQYLLINRLGLLNTFWVLIIPQALNIFNMLVMKSFFEEISETLEEATRVDGASCFQTLLFIVLPISKPVLATVSLFYAVSYWNDFFNALIYISRPDLKPLQLYLYEMLTQSMDTATITQTLDDLMNITPDAVRAAAVVVTITPILLLYPYLQKYFVKGMMIGSVKG